MKDVEDERVWWGRRCPRLTALRFRYLEGEKKGNKRETKRKQKGNKSPQMYLLEWFRAQIQCWKIPICMVGTSLAS